MLEQECRGSALPRLRYVLTPAVGERDQPVRYTAQPRKVALMLEAGYWARPAVGVWGIHRDPCSSGRHHPRPPHSPRIELSQKALAAMAGLSRKFLIDLEAGHDRAELGKT